MSECCRFAVQNMIGKKTNLVLAGVTLAFLALVFVFVRDIPGRAVAQPPPIPLVATNFVDPAPTRVSIAEKLKHGGDPSDYDCYICHERNKPLKLKLDASGDVTVPSEHKDIVMEHGTHKRNNNCFNCHDENNLDQLQTRDGRQVKLTELSPLSTPRLCGSCHGPTYRDWEAGVHGRTSGYWNRTMGEISRLSCVSCHNPHSPKFPGREPAPGPHRLHPATHVPVQEGKAE
jgi:formate-dependent nitrite reductase cytochrome c552 subunit